MSELLTAAQMRAIEKAAIDSGAVTGLELMERAGRGVVEAMLDWRPELATAPHRAVVLCGPGNNGGDGFVVARLLTWRGWKVEVFLYGDEARLPPDAAENCRRWREMGEVRPSADLDGFDGYAEIRVDALFGAGLQRDLADAEALRCAQAIRGENCVAVDCPSGLCLDSGRFRVPKDQRDHFLDTALTVTFEFEKIGHRLADGPQICQRLRTVPIGLDRLKAMREIGRVRDPGRPGRFDRTAAVTMVPPSVSEPSNARDYLAKTFNTHKYTHGHALILAGGVGKGGAARMAARGALRIGAGLVTLGCPPAAVIENAAQLNAIMLRPMGDVDALTAALQDPRLAALLIGPGHGGGEATRAMTLAALAGNRATVLDADALTAYAGDPGTLFAALHERCVLTPHAGEFARLFPDIAEKLSQPATRGPAFSKVDATREAAARAGCTVLYKGADTVIADQTGRAAISSAHYDRAAPWLATAGAGDVLAGFITGLLARGFSPMSAAETAAWLHVECARSFGPGLISEDLPEQLPRVLHELGVGGAGRARSG
ncbi:NAD(P)H-hydrate dehydratase [Rhodobacteraceae bacterium 2CG4]|uniref:Bifunctional NAD(P)H-hydrate repair enzyme n=1 Tax=Halovulum marinum TaxID=2662447 RepID=A0A6L5Z1D7_9RHOB|nr:NAD(P)H-hydrate dehydratase [Halovulum marinum]MSU89892.1 NAD(P)H-hydrate dehydratase [Halovulum marinum]